MKLLRDTSLLFSRKMTATLREPVWVVTNLFAPLCYLALFAPLLDDLSSAPGFPPGGALEVFAPGLLVLLGLFGAAFAGFGLINELRTGLLERLRVTPASRLALLLGPVLVDVAVLLVQALLLVGTACLFGLRVSFVGLAAALAMLALMGLFLASCSYALALALGNEGALASILQFLTLPLLLLSGVLLPLTLAPDWLQTVAALNPLSYAVDATRALLEGDIASTDVWQGYLVLVPLAALAVWWAARSFHRTLA
jgi:ABC-2 type transport system permease protein